MLGRQNQTKLFHPIRFAVDAFNYGKNIHFINSCFYFQDYERYSRIIIICRSAAFFPNCSNQQQMQYRQSLCEKTVKIA